MIQFHKVRPDWLNVKPKVWDRLHKYVELCPEVFDDPEKQKQLVTFDILIALLLLFSYDGEQLIAPKS